MKFEMPLTAYQITDRLLKVIDKETGKVTDLTMALDIINMLENTTITKDELEETRLGKYINLVRKAAKDPTLQKRAKKLIKSWQNMIAKTMQKPKVLEPSPTTVQGRPSSTNEGSIDDEKYKTLNNNNVTVNGDIKPKLPPNHAKRKYDSINAEPPEPVLNKEKNVSNSGESSFTCMTNGLKLKFTNLTSSSTSTQLSNSDSKQNKSQSKRKKNEKKLDTAPPKEVAKTKPSKTIKNISKTKPPPEKQISNVLESSETSKITETKQGTLCQEEIKIKNEHCNEGIDPSKSTASQKDDNQWSGVTGCRGTNGTWYTWTDIIYLNRTDKVIAGSDEPEMLNILPYVELD